jgi:hypothetical protein
MIRNRQNSADFRGPVPFGPCRSLILSHSMTPFSGGVSRIARNRSRKLWMLSDLTLCLDAVFARAHKVLGNRCAISTAPTALLLLTLSFWACMMGGDR